MVADSTLSERQQALFDAVVLEGRSRGANLAANPAVIAFVARHDETTNLSYLFRGGKGAGCSRIAGRGVVMSVPATCGSGSGRCLYWMRPLLKMVI